MKILVFVLLFTILSYHSFAAVQDDSLRLLLTQREQLVKDYQYFNAQNSNFWGKKSKKDLLKIIDTLKGIIRKDSEIINTIKTSTLRKAVTLTVEQNKIAEQVKDDRVAVTNTIYALKTQVANLDNLQKSRQRKINELTEEANQERAKRSDRDKIIAVAAMFIIGLILYIFNLRRKLSLSAGKIRK
ncbi:hypothetical protein AHMF7605_06045 [Adhaeribacter arboris]|uniref:Uncharacterized protein n=1 Tax=Adhaeribacter arboris TaxID=2072846 RepID=A0A2T2YC85_9BACT|nr:hypothetical protein [Adhaeribacter arboris]PSR53119.1 hypothetical protein AHMF7605_06045 [Adhaeribacter arboris]